MLLRTKNDGFKIVKLKKLKNSDLEELGGGATHLIGNETLDVIHERMNHESISTLISSHLAR